MQNWISETIPQKLCQPQDLFKGRKSYETYLSNPQRFGLMKKETRIAIGVGIILVCLLVLGLTLKGSVVPYITVSELKSGDYMGKYIQVNGTVVEGSVEWHPKDVLLTFRLTDGKETVNVSYNGSIPNNFQEGKMVVVGGTYEDGLFKADEILVKCPSKYAGEVE